MESLPLALQREILAFAAGPELIPADPLGPLAFSLPVAAPDFAAQLTEPSVAALNRLAGVCRSWRVLARAFCSEHAATRVLRMSFTTGQEDQQQQQWERRLAADAAGARLLDLRIAITAERRALWWDLDAQGREPSPTLGEAATMEHSQWVDWGKLLMQCPNLRRLDLAEVPLHHFALGELLDAASTHCKQLEALVLPKKDRLHSDAVDASIDETFWRLYTALKRWHEVTGGLRQLTVPSRSEFDREGASNEFLAAVQALCPRLEFLDGWKRSYSENTRLVASDESLCVSREVWTTFCSSCAALREFSWVIVPFSDEFFLPFGKSTKPQLTHLQLTYNTRAPFRIRRNEYSTRGLSVLVGGCPALEHLDVVLHRLQPCDALIYPQVDEMIDADVFNDEFILALTKTCPRLHSLRIRELGSSSSSRAGGSSSSVNAITDRGLATLRQASNLVCIDIQGAKCSADAVVAFLQTDLGSSRAARSRSVKIRELGVRFGDVVHGVLSHLATSTQPELGQKLRTTSLAISLSSRRGYVFQRRWLTEMQRAFQSRFPTDELRFIVFGVKKDKDKAPRNRSDDQEAVANLLARAWLKSDVLRVGRLVLYTRDAALDSHTRRSLSNSTSKQGNAWIAD
ncbi:hypothetical protein BBJ28_00009244 [Nothophytophthora sp. Chile5]|nr:hypothetical protein BBJ28_00009244 [Nothophytophthora sp. Chile5]